MILGHALNWIAGAVIEGGERSDGTCALEFDVDPTARDCQAASDVETACSGWHKQPTGGYFIDYHAPPRAAAHVMPFCAPATLRWYVSSTDEPSVTRTPGICTKT